MGKMSEELTIVDQDPSLYNEDLAPIPEKNRTWGWFEIFNVWANDVQSLFGYTLAASLFLSYGLNGWTVFAAIMVAGLFVMWLVNLMGEPSVKYGIPFPVRVRCSYLSPSKIPLSARLNEQRSRLLSIGLYKSEEVENTVCPVCENHLETEAPTTAAIPYIIDFTPAFIQKRECKFGLIQWSMNFE